MSWKGCNLYVLRRKHVVRLPMLVVSKTPNQYHIGRQSTTAQWFSTGKAVDDSEGIVYHQALS